MLMLTNEQIATARGNLMLCIGIAIGLERGLTAEIDLDRSFLEHAIEFAGEIDVEALKTLTRQVLRRMEELGKENESTR